MYNSNNMILKSLRWAVDELSVDHFGFSSDKIGSHFVQPGAAMTMYLNKFKTYTIMLQGRWCSDAYLRYIRKQVKEFSNRLIATMVSLNTYAFYMMPNCLLTFDDGNPKTPNNPRSLTSSFNGQSALLAFTRHHIHD